MTVETTKVLRLTVEVPGLWADDLDEHAAMYADGAPTARDRLDVVLEEWMRPDVGLTIVTIPGDKCMSDDFEVHAYTCTVVGAEAVPKSDARPGAVEGSRGPDAVVGDQADGDHAAPGGASDLTPYELSARQCLELAELLRESTTAIAPAGSPLIQELERWADELTLTEAVE